MTATARLLTLKKNSDQRNINSIIKNHARVIHSYSHDTGTVYETRNVSSTTDDGSGLFDVNINNPFRTSIESLRFDGNTAGTTVTARLLITKPTSSKIELGTYGRSGGYQDADHNGLIATGILA